MQPRIFYLTTTDKVPLGGTKQHYRHVDILNAAGFETYLIVYEKENISQWFNHATKIITLKEFTTIFNRNRDVLVLPEVIGRNFNFPGKKVIFNQNAYYSFKDYGFKIDHTSIYHDKELLGVMAVSKDNINYLGYCFPEIKNKIVRIKYGIDTDLFKPGQKKKLITFFLKKNIKEVEQVFNIMIQRCMALGWQFAVIQNKPEKEVAEILSETAIFLQFGYPEGCPLTIKEAMAAGCYVIGYDGFGGKELFKKEFSLNVPNADVFSFVKAIEKTIQTYNKNPTCLNKLGLKARSFIIDHYSLEKEKISVINFWNKLLQKH